MMEEGGRQDRGKYNVSVLRTSERRDWISDLAQREKRRRADIDGTRAAIREFSTSLILAVHDHIHRFSVHFPGEDRFIKVVANDREGSVTITRSQDADANFVPPLQVSFRFVVDRMVLECRFAEGGADHLDRDWRLAFQRNGSLYVADGGSIETVCEYLLRPILFPPHFPDSI